MRKRRLLPALLVLASFSILFYACENEGEIVGNELTANEIVDEVLITEQIDDEILLEIEEELLSMDFFKSATEKKCPEITVMPQDGSFPRTITKDFGEGCNMKFRTKKRGKIIINLTDKRRAIGSKRTVTFEDFYINERKIEGERIITYTGNSEAGNMMFTVEGTTVVTKKNGKLITRTFDRVREKIIEENGDRGKKLVSYIITGDVKGINGSGNEFTTTILEPIFRTNRCKWIQSGVLQIELEKHVVVLDYSEGNNNGDCDPFVLRTVDDNEPEIINLSTRKN